MSITVTLVLVVLFSVTVSALKQRFFGRRWLLTGTEYIAVGVALGPMGLALLSVDVVQVLQPFVSLTLGLVGFTLGLATKRRLAHPTEVQAGATASLLTMAAVAGAFWWLLKLEPLASEHVPQPEWLALMLGCAAGAISAPLVESTVAALGAQGPVTRLLPSFAVTGSLLAVLCAGGTLAASRAAQASNRFGLTPTEWLLAVVGLGLACGVLFALFQGRAQGEGNDRLFLATIGIVTFASGVGVAAGVSPLFVNLVAGAAMSVLTPEARAIHRRLESLERPGLMVLMVFAGAMWHPPAGSLWIVAAMYFLLRLFFLRGACAASVASFGDLGKAPRLGSALLGQGPLAAAVAVNHAQVYPAHAALGLTAVLPAVFLSDLVAPWLLRAFVVDMGDVRKSPHRDESEPLTEQV